MATTRAPRTPGVITDTEGGIVTRWVAVAEVLDPDGAQSLRTSASTSMGQWGQLGMHTCAAGRIQDGVE